MAVELYVEIQFLCSIIFAILLYKSWTRVDKSLTQIIFIYLLISCIATFLFDAAQITLTARTDPGSIIGCYFFNILYYIALSSNSYFWFLYSEAEQESFLATKKRWRYITAIPALIICALALLSPLTHWLFYIDEQGLYTRGPLHFVQLIISYSYLLFTCVKSFYLSTQTADIQRKQHLRIAGSFFIPVIVAGILQITLPGVPTICAGCTISLLFVYISMQEENISIDPLTHVNNRRRLIQHLQSRIMHSHDNFKAFALIILDLDHFKQINDVYGHVEGDRALAHVGHALLSMREDDMRIYRYGGDEFVIITNAVKREDLEVISQNIQAALKAESDHMDAPYTLSASIGWAVFDDTVTTPQTLIKRADEKLYEAKHIRPEQIDG